MYNLCKYDIISRLSRKNLLNKEEKQMKLRKTLIKTLKLGMKPICTILKCLLELIVALYIALTIECFIYLTYGIFSYIETDIVTTDLLMTYTVSAVNMVIIIIVYMLIRIYKICVRENKYRRKCRRLKAQNARLRKQLSEIECFKEE